MSSWDFHDIEVQGNYVTVKDMPGAEGHSWFSRTILDGLIPLWAPVGMLLKPVSGNVKSDITVRNNTFIETPLAMLASMRGVFFLGLHAQRTKVILNDENMSGVKGPLYFGEMPLFEIGSPSVRVPVLATDSYFATALSKVAVHFYVVMQDGYHTMGENADLISRSELLGSDKSCYLPIASEHTLNNYIKVMALPEAGRIKVIYTNGFTPELLKQVWREVREYA